MHRESKVPGLEPGALAPESRALTMRPQRLPTILLYKIEIKRIKSLKELQLEPKASGFDGVCSFL